MQTLDGPVAVVTGAASGIGLAATEAFAAPGMRVFMADVDEARLRAEEQRLRAGGADVAAQRVDVSDPAADWRLRQTWMGGGSSAGVSLDTTPSLGSGLGTPRTPLDVYYVALAVLAAAALRRSLPVRLVVAVRDNERASASFGVSPSTVKLSILAVSGFFAGPAGVLWPEAWKSASPTHFDANVSLVLIALPVIGGLGSIAGAVSAAVLLYGGTFFLGPIAAPLFGHHGRNLGFALFLAGAGQVSALLWLPTGLAGAAQQRWESYLERRAARSAVTGDEADAELLPLQTLGIRVRFGGVVALNEPDIVVHRGEIVGLIGTNGAGKTTLMNVISGVLQADHGSVHVFGQEVVDLALDFRAAYGLARSFHDATLFAGLTVTETVQLALSRTRKVGFLSSMVGAPWVRAVQRRTRAEAEEIVERFGLTPWKDSRTADLSTGTKPVCDLAAQVAARPKLLLLDEPTAGVAQREAEAFGPLLRRTRDELDCSILIVEHDMPLLMGLCDRIYALETGTVIAEGTPEQIRNDPRVVTSYLGNTESAIARSGKTAAPRRAPRRPGNAANGKHVSMDGEGATATSARRRTAPRRTPPGHR